MRQQVQVKRSIPANRNRLIATVLTVLPGAWISPKNEELVTLYRLRFRMAMDEQKHDTAMIFLNKILEVDPMNLEARLYKAELYHRCLGDYDHAIEQYNKVIRLSQADGGGAIQLRARAGMSEIMELLS
jgi:tetratricopeptide (TPR) repeat protein